MAVVPAVGDFPSLSFSPYLLRSDRFVPGNAKWLKRGFLQALRNAVPASKAPCLAFHRIVEITLVKIRQLVAQYTLLYLLYLLPNVCTRTFVCACPWVCGVWRPTSGIALPRLAVGIMASFLPALLQCSCCSCALPCCPKGAGDLNGGPHAYAADTSICREP